MPLKLSRYPIGWRRVARELKQICGNRCQECDAPASLREPPGRASGAAANGRMLTVAHVYPDNHAPDAEIVCVMVLCHRCHLRFDADHTAARMRRWHRRHNMTLIQMRSPQCTAEDIAELEAAWPTLDYLEGIPT